jgi:hypothetical protein
MTRFIQKDDPEVQLIRMANEEKDPKLKELLNRMAVFKMVADCFENDKGGE